MNRGWTVSKDTSKMISSYSVAFVCFIYCFLWQPLTGSPLLLLLQNSFHTTPCLNISWLWPQHLFPAFFLPGRFYFEPFLLFYFLIIPGRFYFERSTSCGGIGELYKQRAIQVGPSPSPSQYRRRDNADENQYVFKIWVNNLDKAGCIQCANLITRSSEMNMAPVIKQSS